MFFRFGTLVLSVPTIILSKLPIQNSPPQSGLKSQKNFNEIQLSTL